MTHRAKPYLLSITSSCSQNQYCVVNSYSPPGLPPAFDAALNPSAAQVNSLRGGGQRARTRIGKESSEIPPSKQDASNAVMHSQQLQLLALVMHQTGSLNSWSQTGEEVHGTPALTVELQASDELWGRRIIVFSRVFPGAHQDQMGSSDCKSTQAALVEPRGIQTK